jgi:hypothetical protein
MASKLKQTTARGPYKIPTIYPLPDSLALRQKIRVKDAARLNAVHEDTFRKEHGRSAAHGRTSNMRGAKWAPGRALASS